MSKSHELADALYTKGWENMRNGEDYDPRGGPEWQAVVDRIDKLEAALEAAGKELGQAHYEAWMANYCDTDKTRKIDAIQKTIREAKQ